MIFRPRKIASRILACSFLVLLASALAAAAPSAAPLHEGRFSLQDLVREPQPDGTVRLSLPGERRLGATDQPDLPALDLLLLVPAHLNIGDVRIEPLAVRREPLAGPVTTAGPLLTSTGEEVPLRHLAPADGVFPPTWGAFGGLHSWRGYRLLAVTINPLRVREGGPDQPDELEFLEHFAVHPVASRDRELAPPLARERQVPGEREALEAVLRQLVANPEAIAAYAREDGALLDKSGAPYLPTPNPSLEGSGVRYLIVTTEALAGEYQRLADHRTAQGLPARVVTREWIAATQRQGIDFQETLRFFLQQAYAKWGVEFVLIGGDTDQIPTRYVRSYFYPAPNYTDIPTDIYYACLDGNWNENGNGWLAEPYTSTSDTGDYADLAPEISVGRATLRTPLGVHQYIDKVLTYEGAPVGAAYANKILYAAEVLFPSPWQEGQGITLDGAMYAHRLNEEIIEPSTEMSVVRAYQSNQELYPRDMALNLQSFIAQANSGQYSQINQIGHGSYFNFSVGSANFTVAHADALTNGPNYFLLVTLNCASAAFDFSCLLERFIENPQGGAVASLGSARAAFPQTSFDYQYAFYQKMTSLGLVRVGPALDAVRLQYIGNTFTASSIHRWTQLNLVILGDPALNVWNGLPRQPQIAAPATVAVGERVVPINVAADGAPMANVDVSLAKAGETYAWGITDGAGNVALTVIPQTAGELELNVSGGGLAWTTNAITVTGSPSYVSLEEIVVTDTAGNGNGVPEAGETLSLQLLLRDVGGGGATDVNVVVASSHGDLLVLDGTSPAPNIPPGGLVATAEPILVQTPASLRDGTSVRLRVTVTASGGATWVSQGELEILAPEPEVVRLLIDDSVYGNGNGIPESGERLVLRPYIKNYGAGTLDQLFLQIVDAAPGVVVHDTNALMLQLGSRVEATYSTGELSVTLADIGMATPARVVMTDNYGRTLSLPLEFNPPPAPPAPVADATLAADKIALRWNPVGVGRTLGYHVYRATAAAGPFVRANQDLLRGISYFEDRGLQQLTPYWYRVSAVDTFLVEGGFSPVVAQGTQPGELGNFPLPFGQPTSGHSAVGDVTGDGRLEIVLASDEVYVWRDDGTELLDGDLDAQTIGPFTNVGGEFSPAGVVLADVDGEPGLEIIVSLMSPVRQIHIYRADGTMLPGWPRDLQTSWNWSTPAVGDVTGDGFNEIVVNDLGGRTFVWHHDGTELRDGDNNAATDGVFVRRSESWGFSSPALYDLDGDGAREIIFGTCYYNDQNALLAYKADGSQAPGFPYPTGNQRIICSPVAADLNRDGQKELIFFTTWRRLYVVRADGTTYPGFPITFSGTIDESLGAPSPAVGDFDGDGFLEIVWPVNGGASGMDLLLVKTNTSNGTSGTIMPGWPVQLPCNTEASPVVGDINGDGVPDVVQPIGNSSPETPDRIYALNADGTPIPGFPITLNGPCRATPVICDLNGDGMTNLVYGSWDNLLHVWAMPYAFDPRHVPWPTFRGNNARTGEPRIYSVTAVDEPRVPDAFTALPPYPNPFNPTTTIRLYVAPGADQRLDVAVFDLRGRRVRQLHAGATEPGWRELTWDGRDDTGRGLASGVYFVQARQAARSETFKVSLVK